MDEIYNKEMVLIVGYLEEELFIKKYYKWINIILLGVIFILSILSYYDWVIKKIWKFKKVVGIKWILMVFFVIIVKWICLNKWFFIDGCLS